jgi:hypothetical protein
LQIFRRAKQFFGISAEVVSAHRSAQGGLPQMLGWMLVFMMMSLSAVIAGETRGVGFTPAFTTSITFGLLLIVSALTRALRGQA